MVPPLVLCVDDEPSFADLTATHLERKTAVDAEGFTDPRALVEALDGSVDCIVSDFDMPEMTGLELLDEVRAAYPDLPFVLYTGKGSESVASDAISKGVTEYLQKSTEAGQYEILANRVENAIDRYRTKQALDEQRSLVERIVETIPIGVVVHEASGDVVVANEQARSILAMSNDSLHLRAYDASDWMLYDEDGTQLSREDLPVARILAGEPSLDDVVYQLETDGTTKEIVLRAAPLRDPTDELAYVVVVFTLLETVQNLDS